MALFGKAQKTVDIYQDAIQNAAKNPFKAFDNASSRFTTSLGTTGLGLQSGGGIFSNLAQAAKSALTPQSAYASDGPAFGAPMTSDQAFASMQNSNTTNTTPYGPAAPTGTRRPSSTAQNRQSAVTPTVSQPQSLGYFMGREYFDPAELYQDQLSYLDSVYGTNLSNIRSGRQRQLEAFNTQKSNLGNQLAEILANYQQQEQQGLGSIGNYYSNLGDLYQSSQNIREGELKGEVETARGKARKQASEGQSAIEQAIAEYLGNADAAERDLAAQYQGARDEIGNSLVGDLGNRLNIRNIVASGVQTDLTPAEIMNNNAFLNNLQGLQASRFNNPFQAMGGRTNVNPILEYLQGRA